MYGLLYGMVLSVAGIVIVNIAIAIMIKTKLKHNFTSMLHRLSCEQSRLECDTPDIQSD
jgi:hypothetical protein